MKDDFNKLADEKERILNDKNDEIDRLKTDKDQLQNIIENLDSKLDEIANQNELRDRLIEESVEKGKELEELLHKKETEIHRLVRDFEEDQSEKENQIHHLKATATNTIRNLYALNGLSGDNIVNTLDTQMLKKSISGHTLEPALKDIKKKVSFDRSRTRLTSTLSRPGDRNDINETIDVSKSHKLLSPHRKRTAAYTQATKSSMKNTKRDASVRSAKKGRDTRIAPLNASTPAKFTQANKSTIDEFEREDTMEADKSFYGIPHTIGQVESNSALVMQLKTLLENALERESHLANFIEKLCTDDLAYLAKKFENLKKADMKIREAQERLLMRNEELETRLLDSQSKLWTLKILYDEYDQIISKMSIQKEEKNYIHKEDKSELASAIHNFNKTYNLKPKKSKLGRSKSILTSQKSGLPSIKKKRSVRFQKSLSRSKVSDQLSGRHIQKSRTALLRRQSSGTNRVSLRKSRSEAVRLVNIGTEPRQQTMSQRSSNIRANIQSQRSTIGQNNSRNQMNSGVLPGLSRHTSGGAHTNIMRSRSEIVQPSRVSQNYGGQSNFEDQPAPGSQHYISGRRSNEGDQDQFTDQRSGRIPPNRGSQANEGVQPNYMDQPTPGSQHHLSGRHGGGEGQDHFSDQRSGRIPSNRESQTKEGFDPNLPLTPGSQHHLSGRLEGDGGQDQFTDQRSGRIPPNRGSQANEGVQPNYMDQPTPGSQHHISGRFGGEGGQDHFSDQRSGRIPPNRGSQTNEGVQPNYMDQPTPGSQHHLSGRLEGNGGQDHFSDQRSGRIPPNRGGRQSNEGIQADPSDPRSADVQINPGMRHGGGRDQDNFIDQRHTDNRPNFDQHIGRGLQGRDSYTDDGRDPRSGALSAQSPRAFGNIPRSMSQRNLEGQNSRASHQISRSKSNRGLNIDTGFQGEDQYDQPIHERDDEDYDPMDDPNQNYDDLDDLDDVFEDEGEYDEGEEEEEEDDEDNIDVHTVFDEAHNMIDDLKRKLNTSNNANQTNQQTIDSLRNELQEVQKINDRLENQLYKYQYDINRITDVLLNDAHPTKDELEQEEKGVEELSDQEKHLYVLLKKGAELRGDQKEHTEKINVYEKDLEELVEKNRHLCEVEELKNEL